LDHKKHGERKAHEQRREFPFVIDEELVRDTKNPRAQQILPGTERALAGGGGLYKGNAGSVSSPRRHEAQSAKPASAFCKKNIGARILALAIRGIGKAVGIQQRGAGAGSVFALYLASAPAVAQEPTKPHPLRWDLPLDVAVTVGGAAAWIVGQVLKGDLASSHCRWCNTDTVDGGVRDALVWRDTASADTISVCHRVRMSAPSPTFAKGGSH
jgi:hypothetical protein